MKNLVKFTILFAVLIGNGYALMANEFFASSASEVTSAMNAAQPGDTITLLNGYWTDQHIELTKDGTAAAPILIRAQTPGKVILNGSSRLSIGGDYLIVDGLFFKGGSLSGDHVVRFRSGSGPAHHSRLTNTAIVDYNPPSINTRYFWVSLYGTYNRVDHCYFANQNHSGVTVVAWLDGDPTYHQIDHNFFGYRPEGPENGWETIRIGTSSESGTNARVTVEYNYFYKLDGEIETISNKSNENIYRYNTFVDCNGQLTLRHGKRCVVEGNFFFGYNAPNSSGVRIIDRDHVVVNNYFAGLQGSDFRAALVMMNGVPNSPLNRYFQVINALVAFNTFVDCKYPMDIGTGKDSELTLPPLDCTIANNIVKGAQQGLIHYTDTPINMTYEGNIMFGAPLGIDPQPGIAEIDPLLSLAADSLFRPVSGSPAIDAAVGNYFEISTDMDGQPRDSLNKDIGADEFSAAPITIRPLTPEDVGPDWYPVAENVVQVPPGHDTLLDSLNNADLFDVFELLPGEYTISNKIIVNRVLRIRAADPSQPRPVIRSIEDSTSTRIIFEIQDGGSLYLQGLELDGMAGSATPAKYLIRTDDDPFPTSYVLNVNYCYFHDVVVGEDGNFFRAYAGTFADSVIFRNCLFENSGKEGIRLKDEAIDSQNYNVDWFEVENCTFWNTRKEAIYIYAGDSVPFTPGPKVTVNHCTFDNCGDDNSRIVYFRECDFTTVKNSLFTNSPNNLESIKIQGVGSVVSYSDTFNVGPVSTTRSATIGAGMVNLDPLYADRLNGDFTLASNSPVAGLADDGLPLGDLRWAGLFVGIDDHQSDAQNPKDFVLDQNYPNPFNPATTIRFFLNKAANARVAVYNLRGQLVGELVNQNMSAGDHRITWNAAGLGSGVYFYQLEIDGQVVQTRKALLIK